MGVLGRPKYSHILRGCGPGETGSAFAFGAEAFLTASASVKFIPSPEFPSVTRR
jgi:hypothetical protein